MHVVDHLRDLRAIAKAARETYRRTVEDITSDGHEIERARRDLRLAEDSLEAAQASRPRWLHML